MTYANPELSEREQEILRLVATGASNKEIAQQLFISANTVKVHLRNIYTKIDVVSRTEAAMYAIENGIVKSPAPEPEPITVVVEKPAELGRWQSFWRRFWWAMIPLGVILVLGLAAIIGRSPIFASPVSESAIDLAESQRWQELAPLPVARAGLAAVAYDNAIYAIAGETETGPSGLVERYDPVTDSWARLKDKPTAVTYVSAVLLGEKIYVPGGQLNDGAKTNILEVYDPRKDSWEKKAPIPIAVSGYALAVYEGRMYLFGGWNGEQVLDKVYSYDPDDDRWTEGTPMPTARAYAGAAEVGGKIFVMGGWDGEKALDVNESYSPLRDGTIEPSWEDQPRIPLAMFGFGIQEIADIMLIKDDRLWIYTSQERKWLQLGTISGEIVRYQGVTNWDGYLFFLGGVDNQSLRSESCYRFQVVYTLALPVMGK